jgi:hypothetical protein
MEWSDLDYVPWKTRWTTTPQELLWLAAAGDVVTCGAYRAPPTGELLDCRPLVAYRCQRVQFVDPLNGGQVQPRGNSEY